MRLLIINDNPLERSGEGYHSIYSWIRFPLFLSRHCKKTTLWAPILELKEGQLPSADAWSVELGDLRIEPNNNFGSFAEYYRLLPRKYISWRAKARELVLDHDVVVIRVPSPQLSLVTRAALQNRKPLVLMVSGNMSTQSRRIAGNVGMKRIFFKSLAHYFTHVEKKSSRRASIVYVYSNELARRHRGSTGRIKLMRTPHMSLDDFYQRSDTCKSPRVRLLRVCWIYSSKGLEPLMHSVRILLSRGLDVTLELVGKERERGYQEKLERMARDLGIHERVSIKGWIPFDQMKEIYRRNDIQIISSLAEGTPRCIVEGAARGLPLVCTATGGCADVLSDQVDALLVPPGDPKAIADAVQRIIEDAPLRKKLIQEGYQMARSHTFETLGMMFLEDLREVARLSKNSIMEL